MKNSRLFRIIRQEKTLLFLITTLSLLLNTLHLNREGYGNLYYAAGVKSMMESWHNFFYLSYDPGGFVSIDKPPLGFWLQTISAELFGFHGWALMLPQVIAGVLSVLVLYSLVRRMFGSSSALIAALMLAITPISVATARNNTIDSILVLTVLLAAWMLFKAMEHKSSYRWIILSAIMIGLGFNIKMIEAYMVLPAFALILILAPGRTKKQIIQQLSIAAVFLIVVSLSWAVFVDLIPINLRPYIGSTNHNSVMELMLEHNAAARFDGINNFLRLVTPDLGGQISWLLPLSILSAVFMLWKAPILRPRQLSLYQRNVLFWLAWLIPMIISFGAATLFHRYYTVMMAPAIAALSGTGLVQLWQEASQRKRSGWILITAIPLMAAFAITIAWSYPQLRLLLVITIGGFAIAALIALALVHLRKEVPYYMGVFAKVTCLFALLAGPLVWSATPAFFGAAGSDPVAGPDLISRHVSDPEAMEDKKLMGFLLAHYVKGGFLVATPKADTSSPFILDTGLPILTLGGYSGFDPIISQRNLQALAQKGAIKYFLVPKVTMFDKNSVYVKWVQQHCRIINLSEFSASSKPLLNSVALYQYTNQPLQIKNDWTVPVASNPFNPLVNVYPYKSIQHL